MSGWKIPLCSFLIRNKFTGKQQADLVSTGDQTLENVILFYNLSTLLKIEN